METKPIWQSGTAQIGVLGIGLMELADTYGKLSGNLVWPFTMIVCAVIVQRAFADFGKYNSGPPAPPAAPAA